VKLLLAREDLNPDRLDNNGRGPISIATMMGHAGIVNLQLAQDDDNPNRADKYKLTPLLLTTKRGREEVLDRFKSIRKLPSHDGFISLSECQFSSTRSTWI